MSSSPKYTRARLRAAQERLLRQARAQAAALERARRLAEEDRRRAERLTQLRSTVAAELAAARQQVLAHLATEAGRHASGDLTALQRQLDRAEAALASAGTAAEVRQLRKHFRGLGTELGQAMARGQAACRAAGLAATEAALQELRQRVAALDADEAARLAPRALPAIRDLLAEAEGALRAGGTAKCRHALDQAREHLERLLDELRIQRVRWGEERDRCQAALADASDRIAGLRADTVVCRWAAAGVDALAQQAAQVQALIDAGQFAAALGRADGLRAQAEEMVAKAQESQLQEDRRKYIVAGILQVMSQMGFVVQAGSPALERPGEPSSATVIHARRIGGGALAISVPQDGPIWYDVGDFPMRIEQDSQGHALRTCDEAEQQIERLHAALDEAFGIETDELQWQGKPARPVRKQAERLPDGRPQVGRREGGS
jgi:hypothetical protein